jgi:hypothetical protein
MSLSLDGLGEELRHRPPLSQNLHGERLRLDIVLDSDFICLRGTGVDVDPALLSGHVILSLAEPTSVKEITLLFKGKAKLPRPGAELCEYEWDRAVYLSFSFSFSLFALIDQAPNAYVHSTTATYSVCQHEWSFLEGEKTHRHKLKAGRHVFPFKLGIGGSLPSTITTDVLGGCLVTYKILATVRRPGLCQQVRATTPVCILRSFSPDALEYQQTVGAEGAWQEKLLYAITLPHKAWAIGDTITSSAKFWPLKEGTTLLGVGIMLRETTRTDTGVNLLVSNRVLAEVEHDIVEGGPILTQTAASHQRGELDAQGRIDHGNFPATPHSETEIRSAAQNLATSSTVGMSPCSHASWSGAGDPAMMMAQTASSNTVGMLLTLPVPPTAHPSHNHESVWIGHRVRWTMTLANADGHISFFRCSLPVHILDPRFLGEARACTAPARRLLFGDSAVAADVEDVIELPSYTSHVRDRVANMFLPDTATVRVVNPWVRLIPEERESGGRSSASGAATLLEAHVLSHLPHAPGSDASTPLDWLNSEVLLSFSDVEPLPAQTQTLRPTHSPGPPSSAGVATAGGSGVHRSLLGVKRTSSDPAPPSHMETFLHGDTHASRALPALLGASMRLLPSHGLGTAGWLRASRSRSHNSDGAHAADSQASQQVAAQHQPITVPLPVPAEGPALLHRAFTEVPDYSVAAQGFIGGVTPLSSMRGLPAYEDVAVIFGGGKWLEERGDP